MVNITTKDFFENKARFLLVLLGLTVSIVMVNFGIGFLTGVMQDNRSFLEHNPDYMYITDDNRQSIFDGGQVHDRVYNKTAGLSCVDEVERLLIGGAGFKFEDEIVGCTMIGYDIYGDFGPWDVIKGKEVSLIEDNFTAIVDISIFRYLPDLEIGDKLDTLEFEVEIVGFVENSKVWGNPMCWVSYYTAERLMHKENSNATTVIAVDLKDGYNEGDLEDKLSKYEDDINILTNDELNERISSEVMNNMGQSIGMLALMGFIVTMIIVSATMYSTVMEKIPQLVSMKALGAGQGFINRILIGQVIFLITAAFLLAGIVTFAMAPIVNSLTVYGVGFEMFWLAFTYGLCLLLSIFCTLVSLRKVKKTDPAVIFRA